MNIGTRIYTFFFGELVGRDDMGNRYYKGRRNDGKHVGRYDKERRWVLYKDAAEPSKIPPEWHKWMHYMTDGVPLAEEGSKLYEWQKDHQPNLTGTEFAYLPPGHAARGGKREKATGDYEAWNPNKDRK